MKKISKSVARASWRKVFNSPFKVINALNKASKKQSPDFIPDVKYAFDVLGIKELDFDFFAESCFNFVQDKNGYIRYYAKSVLCNSFRSTEFGVIGKNVVELSNTAWLDFLIDKANKKIDELTKAAKEAEKNEKRRKKLTKKFNTLKAQLSDLDDAKIWELVFSVA